MTCEAIVAIVVNAVEGKLELDHELMTIPVFITCQHRQSRLGFDTRIGWAEKQLLPFELEVGFQPRETLDVDPRAHDTNRTEHEGSSNRHRCGGTTAARRPGALLLPGGPYQNRSGRATHTSYKRLQYPKHFARVACRP